MEAAFYPWTGDRKGSRRSPLHVAGAASRSTQHDLEINLGEIEPPRYKLIFAKPPNEQEAFVHLALPQETSAGEAGWLAQRVLSADERAHADQLTRPSLRHDYIIARSLVRLVLSSYFPVAPADWCFARSGVGRPFVVAPADSAGLQFSLSHTAGLLGVLVAAQPEAGLDLESIRDTPDLPQVATREFASEERIALGRLAGDAWLTRFFQLWTLKEAYAKARGFGLALPLQSVAFELAPLRPVRAAFAAHLREAPSRWHFALHQISQSHIVAAALRCEPQSASPVFTFLTSRIRASVEDAWLESSARAGAEAFYT